MEHLWFAIVAGMLAIYVVLDGFDFGVGIVLRFVARTDAERRTVLSSIGLVWDGNEVWLIAAGGVLFMAFPKVYATAFSGFYLALMIVLWLLILRGVAMEFRSHQQNPLWRQFCDTVFSLASGLLSFVFGAALGNLIRGVPIDETGLRGMPLFTSFWPSQRAGIFDAYTVMVGLFALFALAQHGALYLSWRTTGDIDDRSQVVVHKCFRVLFLLWIVVTIMTPIVQPELVRNLVTRLWFIPLGLLAITGFAGIPYFLKRNQAFMAFLSSCVFLMGLLATTMIGNYPNWLRSTISPAYSLTAANSIAAHHGLKIALIWLAFGMLLILGYFTYLYSFLRDKVQIETAEGH